MPKEYYRVVAGEVFGDLTVVSSAGSYMRHGRKAGARFLCRCKCGRESFYRASTLIRGISSRCINCAAKSKTKINLKAGDRIGKLKVTNGIPDKNIRKGRRCYECVCECGNIGMYEASRLNTKKSKECLHCAYKKRPQSTLRLTGEERMYNLLLKRAREKDFKNTINFIEFKKVISMNCRYCNSPPKRIIWLGGRNKVVKRVDVYANGIDRVDPLKGYAKKNSVPCCSLCNFAKHGLSELEFKNHVIKIYKNYVRRGVKI